MPSLLELQDLYNEALSRELLEKTKSCGIVWSHLGGDQFQAISIDTVPDPDVTWEFIITKSQLGNVTDTFTLDVKKDTITYVTIESGPLPRSGRESIVKELYEVVELLVLRLDAKLKEAVQFVQGLTDCRG